MDGLINEIGNEVFNYVMGIVDGREGVGAWNNLPDVEKTPILQAWAVPPFRLQREVGGNQYYFTMAQLDGVDDLAVMGRQNAGLPTVLQMNVRARERLNRAYEYLVADAVAQGGQNDMANGNEMNIDGGGKRRKKRRKSKRRKSKRHKSKTRRRRRR
jgi:hypothetical protein